MKARLLIILIVMLAVGYATWLPYEMRALKRVRVSDHGTVATLSNVEDMAQVLHERVYRAFDSTYPPLWPTWLKLPEHSYLIHSGSIHVANPQKYPYRNWTAMHEAHCILQLPSADLVAFFRSSLEHNGLEAKEYSDGPYINLKATPANGPILDIWFRTMPLESDPRWTYYLLVVHYR